MPPKIPRSLLPPRWQEVPNLVAVLHDKVELFERKFQDIRRLSFGKEPVVLYELLSEPEHDLFENDQGLPVLSNDEGDLAVVTDRLSLKFPRGTDAEQQSETLRSYGLETVKVSRQFPRRVVVRVPGSAPDRALQAARKLTSEKQIEAYPDLLTQIRRG